MSIPITLQPHELVHHRFHPEGVCEWSDKTGECVEISAVDGSFSHAIISLAELKQLMRFRHRQLEKNGNGAQPAEAGHGRA